MNRRSPALAHVLAVEHDLVQRITTRAEGEAFPAYVRELRGRVGGRDPDQRAAVAHLTGTGRITIIEGAAGAGRRPCLPPPEPSRWTRGTGWWS